MTIPSPDEFMRKIFKGVQDYDLDAFEVYFGLVTDIANSGRDVKVKRQSVVGSDADSGYGMITVARVVGPPIDVGDIVLVMRDNKDHYVLGEVGGDNELILKLANTAVTTTETLAFIDFSSSFTASADAADEVLVGINFGGNGSATTVARSDQFHAGGTGPATRGVVLHFQDGTPTDASNSSTSTYATLYSNSIELPDGTWTVQHIALATFKNSAANGGARIRASSPSASGGTEHTCPTANVPFVVFDVGGGSSLTGTQTFAAEYRSASSGTVTPQQWLMMVVAQRSA